MENETMKLNRAMEIMKMISEGLDPFDNEPINDHAFLNDPRMIRCLYYVIEMLEKIKSGKIGPVSGRSDLPFVITPEEKANVFLPDEKIGVNTFAKCINQVINPLKSKNLTGVALNIQLKKMGILSEEKTEDGRTLTIVNDKSSQYGVESVKAEYNGRTYDKIVFNDKGKEFLLNNLESIMSYK